MADRILVQNDSNAILLIQTAKGVDLVGIVGEQRNKRACSQGRICVANGDQLGKEGYRSVSRTRLRPVECSTIIRIRTAAHPVLVAVVDGWQANIRHLEESGQLCLLDIASRAFSKARNI